MDDLARIEYISTIDFSKGFRRFHIKWPLKDLIRPKSSTVFNTRVMDSWKDIFLSWSLSIRSQRNIPTDTGFGIVLQSDGKMTPMIYQVSLSSSTKVLFDHSGFAVVDRKFGGGYIVPSCVVDGFPSNDLVLQFWIDIPKAILIGDNSKKENESGKDSKDRASLQKKNNDAFLFDTAKIFSRVTEAQATDKSSDVSIVIVKKKVCAGRKRGLEEEIRRFHCHVIFLSARSTVFETMFTSDKWNENCSKNGRLVEIDDIDAEIMETVLRHIYTSALPDPSTNEADLFGIIYAAEKYHLAELKNWCAAVLILKHRSVESRIGQLVLADRHNLIQLKSVCIDQLSMNFDLAFSDPAMVNDIPSDLRSELMNAVSERRGLITNIVLPKA